MPLLTDRRVYPANHCIPRQGHFRDHHYRYWTQMVQGKGAVARVGYACIDLKAGMWLVY